MVSPLNSHSALLHPSEQILANLMMGVTLLLTNITSDRGTRNIPSCFMLQKLG